MSPYLVIASGFALIGVVALAVEVLARQGRGGCRRVGEALHVALSLRLGGWTTAGRWLVLLGWLWVGFHFLAR